MGIVGEANEEVAEEGEPGPADLISGRAFDPRERPADVLGRVPGDEASHFGFLGSGPQNSQGFRQAVRSFPRPPNLTGCRSSLRLLLRQRLDARPRARRRAA